MIKSITEQQRLVLENISFAKRQAMKFYKERRFCGFLLDDYESAAFLGLCDAARKYKPDSEVSFLGYAFLRIYGEMNDFLRSSGLITRKQVRAIANLLGEAKDSDTLRKIPRALNLNLKYYKEIISDAGIRLHFDEREQITDISYFNSSNPEEAADEKLLTQYLRELVGKLPDKERLVIELKYFEDLTFEEMREMFNGATRSWICRIHTRALEKLRYLIIASEAECERAQTQILAEAA